MQRTRCRVNEARRRAESAHAHVHDHQDCCRRQSAVYATTMDNLNDGLGRIGELTRDTAGATHSLSCGTTDRDCDEAKYLQEALDSSRRARSQMSGALHSFPRLQGDDVA